MAGPHPASKSWPPPGQYSIRNPERVDEAATTKPEHAPGVLHPAEISTVTEIVEGLSKKLDDKIARIEKAMIQGPAAELSAALTLSKRSVTRWRVLAGIISALCGTGGYSLAKDDRDEGSVAAAAIVDRVDDLERRFDRIERKLDRALE